MKIIAKINDAKVLCELTAEEISSIRGVPHRDQYGNENGLPRVGTEIFLCKAWQDLLRFRRAKDDIEKAAQVLKVVAQLAETASVSYTLPVEPDASSSST